MALTFLLLALAAVFFWAGFLQPPRSWQHHSRTAFGVFLALAAVSGFFAWKKARAIRELEALVPVPTIASMTRVPTAGEIVAMSQVMAALPIRGLTTPEERRAFAARAQRDLADSRTRYWIIKTKVSPDSVFRIYRGQSLGHGWVIEKDEPPWLFMKRDDVRMFLFVTDDWPRPETKILYAYTTGSSF